jgi:hypothetical protein
MKIYSSAIAEYRALSALEAMSRARSLASHIKLYSKILQLLHLGVMEIKQDIIPR